eukprot:5770173-Alexandrium_andersonii.AAC.1
MLRPVPSVQPHKCNSAERCRKIASCSFPQFLGRPLRGVCRPPDRPNMRLRRTLEALVGGLEVRQPPGKTMQETAGNCRDLQESAGHRRTQFP